MTQLQNQIKASQKAYEYNHHGRPFRTQMPEKCQWVLFCVRKAESQGAEIELTNAGIILTWPGKKPYLKTFDEIEEDYNYYCNLL